MDELGKIESMGLALPSPAYLFGVILFSVIGFAVYRYGRKSALKTTRWLGVALMLYPYAVSDTVLLYAVGAGLCLGVYFSRR